MIELEDIRAWIRVDETYDDRTLQDILVSALAIAEAYLGHSLGERTFDDDVNVRNYCFRVYDKDVRDIRVIAEDGTDLECIKVGRGRYQIPFDCCCPQYIGPCVRVTYQTGPQQGEPLDPIIKLGVLRIIAHLYEQRGDDVGVTSGHTVNDAVNLSGAAELWNMLRPIAIR